MRFSTNRFSSVSELILFAIAMLWALVLASKLQTTSDHGFQRWQADAEWVLPSDTEKPVDLISLWCDRDADFIRSYQQGSLLSQCSWHSRVYYFLDFFREKNTQTSLQLKSVWHSEVSHQLEMWEIIFREDVERVMQNPNAVAKSLSSTGKRLSLWIQAEQSFHSSLATHNEEGKVTELWNMALLVSGQGNLPVKALVEDRKTLSSIGHKAEALLNICNNLLWCICLHGLFSYASLLIVRYLDKYFPKRSTKKEVFEFNFFIAPIWWFFTATGWLLLLDQSLNFHDRVRFLALDQWWSWCAASLLFSISVFFSQRINQIAFFVNASFWRQGGFNRWNLGWFTSALLVLVVLYWGANKFHIPSYITAEVIKSMFLVSVAGWCLWRMPLATQLWHEGHIKASIHLLFGLSCLLLMAALCAVITSDKGTWLVLAILSVVLIAAVTGWTTGFFLLIVGFLLIFTLGEQVEVVGDRLQAWRNAFTADQDDMSRLIWFQAEAFKHDLGWGVGQTPWCAGERLDQCIGLPLQLQSDYTMTALLGWVGQWGAWCLVVLYSLFIYAWLAIAAKRSNQELLPIKLISAVNSQQAFGTQMMFLVGLMMLVQSWITVSGNVAWIPLTGITWPLLSYGKTSLWVTSFFIGVWGYRNNYV